MVTRRVTKIEGSPDPHLVHVITCIFSPAFCCFLLELRSWTTGIYFIVHEIRWMLVMSLPLVLDVSV
jgi:hypothetical protein